MTFKKDHTVCANAYCLDFRLQRCPKSGARSPIFIPVIHKPALDRVYQLTFIFRTDPGKKYWLVGEFDTQDTVYSQWPGYDRWLFHAKNESLLVRVLLGPPKGITYRCIVILPVLYSCLCFNQSFIFLFQYKLFAIIYNYRLSTKPIMLWSWNVWLQINFISSISTILCFYWTGRKVYCWQRFVALTVVFLYSIASWIFANLIDATQIQSE